MPRTRSLAWSELKIGLLTISAIVIASILVFSLTGGKGWFWQRYILKTRFPNVAGLAAGSPVRVAGVISTALDPSSETEPRNANDLSVMRCCTFLLTSKMTSTCSPANSMSFTLPTCTPATTGTPIPEYGYVPQGRAKGQFSDIAEGASGTIDEVNGLVRDLRAGKGSAGKLMTDDRLYNDLQQFVATAGQLTRELQQGKGTLGQLLKDPKAADSLNATLKNIETLTRRIDAGEGSLGQLLKDDQFSKSLNGATANIKDLTDRLNRGEGTAGKLMTDPALFNKLNAVTDQLDQLVTKLNAGEGTAGQLLKDRQLYENMNGAVNDMRALLTAIKADPKKYLNVKVSIF